MIIKQTKDMTNSERIAAENSNNQWLQSLAYVAVGTIYPYVGKEAPDTFMICDGTPLDVTKYAELFSVIGYTFGGSGDTFNLPDLRGKTLVGLNAADSDFNQIGKSGGEKAHKLTIAEMPKHNHQTSDKVNYFWYGNDWNPENTAYFSAGSSPMVQSTPKTSEEGQDGYHNNLQPYTVCNYIIKVMQATSNIVELQPEEFNIDENGDLILTRMNGSQENLGNVKGEQGPQGERGPQGEKGEKGDTPIVDLSDYYTKDEVKEYAVPIKDTGGAPYELIYAQKGDGVEGVVTIETDLSRSNGEVEASPSNNAQSIPIRNSSGNLYTGTPTESMEAANKKYVDDKLGDIETLLGGI